MKKIIVKKIAISSVLASLLLAPNLVVASETVNPVTSLTDKLSSFNPFKSKEDIVNIQASPEKLLIQQTIVKINDLESIIAVNINDNLNRINSLEKELNNEMNSGKWLFFDKSSKEKFELKLSAIDKNIKYFNSIIDNKAKIKIALIDTRKNISNTFDGIEDIISNLNKELVNISIEKKADKSSGSSKFYNEEISLIETHLNMLTTIQDKFKNNLGEKQDDSKLFDKFIHFVKLSLRISERQKKVYVTAKDFTHSIKLATSADLNNAINSLQSYWGNISHNATLLNQELNNISR